MLQRFCCNINLYKRGRATPQRFCCNINLYKRGRATPQTLLQKILNTSIMEGELGPWSLTSSDPMAGGVGKGGSKGSSTPRFGGYTLLYYCVAPLDFLVSTPSRSKWNCSTPTSNHLPTPPAWPHLTVWPTPWTIFGHPSTHLLWETTLLNPAAVGIHTIQGTLMLYTHFKGSSLHNQP